MGFLIIDHERDNLKTKYLINFKEVLLISYTEKYEFLEIKLDSVTIQGRVLTKDFDLNDLMMRMEAEMSVYIKIGEWSYSKIMGIKAGKNE